jgi:hypothetical protein
MLRSRTMTLRDHDKGNTSGPGDEPRLDLEQAEQLAASFRPAWETHGYEEDVPAAGDANATTAVPAVVGAPVVLAGDPKAAADAEPVVVPAPRSNGKKKRSRTMPGVAPPPEGSASTAESKDGARLPAPSSEALDSSSVIEAVPAAPATEPLPVERRKAPPVKSTSKAKPSADGTVKMPASRAAPQKPVPVAVHGDPFRARAASSDPGTEELRALVAGRPGKKMVYGAVAVGLAAVVGLLIHLSGEDPEAPAPAAKTATTAPTETAAARAMPTEDIPPPPSKETLAEAPPKAETATPAPTPAPTPRAPAPAPIQPVAAKAAPTPRPTAAPKPTTPRTVAATPPRAPKPAPPTPKTSPKPASGGIVRDNPF